MIRLFNSGCFDRRHTERNLRRCEKLRKAPLRTSFRDKACHAVASLIVGCYAKMRRVSLREKARFIAKGFRAWIQDRAKGEDSSSRETFWLARRRQRIKDAQHLPGRTREASRTSLVGRLLRPAGAGVIHSSNRRADKQTFKRLKRHANK